MKYCQNCGSQLKINAKFCTSCGHKLKEPLPIELSKNERATTTNITSNNGLGNKINNVKNVLIYYFLLNVPFYILNSEINEIIGVQIFSLIILITYLVRFNKEKLFNRFMKIIFVLQLILIFSIFMSQSEYLFTNFISFLTTLSLLGLFIIILLLLFKDYKTQ